MSLVERALKKIQEAGTASAPSATVTGVPQNLPREAQVRVETPHAPARPPVREVHAPTRTVNIDRQALRSMEILPPPDDERQFAARYRHIKRPLIRGALGRGGTQVERGHLIMVASALPGEGKTFTCINLALSMALEQDLSVLLVDADVARPKLSGILGVEREKGLLDVVRDDSLDIESVIMPTDMPRLSVVSAGRPSEMATELLASQRMQQIVQVLGARDPNRIVLFDSSPLLLTSESRVLASIVGQVVLVVRAESTAQQAVLDAIDLLGEAKSIGLVLNQCEERGGVANYPYYGTEESAAAR